MRKLYYWIVTIEEIINTMSSVQTLKSARSERIRTDLAQWQASSRMMGHSPDTCVAGAQQLRNNVYGVPVNQNTLNMGNADCNSALPYNQTVSGRMMTENNERPYVPIASSGFRGAGDLMGKSRDLMPLGLYGDNKLGSFVRLGSDGLRLPEPSQIFEPQPSYSERRIPSIHLQSHDSSVSGYYAGK